MIIKELMLKNFGKFSGENMKFGEGINVIYGPNEAGKTTIYTAIGAMLFGLDKQRGRAAKCDAYTAYQPWENKTWYEGRMRFQLGDKSFLLERNFYHGEKSAGLVCETDGEELSVDQGDLEMLLGEANAELFFNTVAAGQQKLKPQDIIYSYLKNYIAGLQESGNRGTDVIKALEILSKRKKELEEKKRKTVAEVREQLSMCDARLELLQQEIDNHQTELDALKEQKKSLQQKSQEKKQTIWCKILNWLRQLFFRKKQQENAENLREELFKLEEKIGIHQELLGDRESLREEIFLEKDALYARLQEQPEERMLEAVSLAMERIQILSEEQKEDVMNRLLGKASEVLYRITKGKYQKIIMEEDDKPSVWDGERKLKLFQVSTGCVDQIYLSLRIALQDLFFEEERLPLIFDDAFIYFDENRLERLLGYIGELNRQVLIFTCHKRELNILDRMGMTHEKIFLKTDN